MEDEVINRYGVSVTVQYFFDVEAKTAEEAHEEGWKYEDYAFSAEVYSIDVELEEEDIYGEEPDEDVD